MSEKLLFLRLEGPLQSWGERSKWDIRDSADMPGKSSVVGLIGCAMGLERDDPMLLEVSRQIELAVRADRPGTRMLDFHTVTGDPLMNAAGKPRSSGNTIISRRWYLQDASFLVVIRAQENWLERIAYALQHPKWCVYLGRKSCVPTRPVFDGISDSYSGLMDAIRRYPMDQRSAAEHADNRVRYECEIPQENAATYSRPDELTSGSRTFVMRRVWSGTVEVPNVSDEN